ncbi:MAG: galactose/methyl galactoside ABC transporter permease MglC [Caldiserica bacterium]|nr:galactose/methyl galactoside ABC transporter permease MglC [Caldisericota bacterium]
MKNSASTSSSKRFSAQSIREFATKNAIILVLVVLILVIGIIKNGFLTPENLVNIMRISSVRLIIALGAAGILITGGVDLSAGRTVGLAAVIVASLAQRPDYASKIFPTLPYMWIVFPILAGILAGLLVGIINGVVIAYLKVPAFIATLGTMVIVWGAASLYVDRPPLGAQPIGGLRNDFTNLGTGSIGFLPTIILIALVVYFVYWIILSKTEFGKNLYAIGGNLNAAIVSGVNVKRNLVALYSLAGMLYGIAGVLLAARSGGATNNYGSGYELDAIAASVIGGVSNLGGRGTVSGVLIGVLIFEVLNNGLVVMGVSAYWQQVVKGVIIVAAVAVDIRKYSTKR